VALGTLSEATTAGAREVAPEPDDAVAPEVSREELGAGVDELLVALTITIVARIATTTATGARAATTGYLERKRLGPAAAGAFVGSAPLRRVRLDEVVLDEADWLGVGRRPDGTRCLVDFDIVFS
jgi:hypothetical protein